MKVYILEVEQSVESYYTWWEFIGVFSSKEGAESFRDVAMDRALWTTEHGTKLQPDSFRITEHRIPQL